MFFSFFFFNDTATTEIYTLSLHDALPISGGRDRRAHRGRGRALPQGERLTEGWRRDGGGSEIGRHVPRVRVPEGAPGCGDAIVRGASFGRNGGAGQGRGGRTGGRRRAPRRVSCSGRAHPLPQI